MFTRRSTRLAIGLAGVILIAACGGSADDVAAPPAEAGTQSVPTVQASDADASSLPGTTAVATTDATTDTETADTSAESPQVETQSAPTAPSAPIGGRALATDLEPASAFAGNPLPDLVVDDLGRSAQANLANLLPSDRPVLVWAWAPH
jgi:hypothetical protein